MIKFVHECYLNHPFEKDWTVYISEVWEIDDAI